MSSNPAPPPSSSYSSFRNVSACNRCRLRKNRCDQNLPRCQSCEKARVHCVGYDPTTKREIPRSYVFFLESRVAYLEKMLMDNGIEFRAAEAYEGELEMDKVAGPGSVSSSAESPPEGDGAALRPSPKMVKSQERVLIARRDSNLKVKREREADDELAPGSVSKPDQEEKTEHNADSKQQADEADRRIDNLVSNIGMVSVQGASDPRYLGSTSGISFARVVFSAVKSSVSTNATERGTLKSSDRQPVGLGANTGGSSMRDSFFGLQAKPTMKQAPFPDQAVAERLVSLYFEHANPQIPILHRGEFMEVFQRIYSVEESKRSSRDLYLLNVVCAIGAAIIFDAKSDVRAQDQEVQRSHNRSPTFPTQKRQRLLVQQYQPEEYHASAVVHLESFLGSPQYSDGFGGLEELQAVLLLANFALLRPIAPGLWYIIGVAVRLAIDLGLHYEDGTGIDSINEQEDTARKVKPKGGSNDKSGDGRKIRLKIDPKERGRREWVRDLRRRLWWCTYSFDRLVSTCVGRPFGITDQVITTEFPSLLDDKYITKAGFLRPPANAISYKHVSHHYFKLRLLQSEIQQVLQHQQATMARKIGKNRSNAFMHTKLPSPFLANFDSFRSWRKDVHRRLAEWKDSAPTPQQIGVQFSVEFLELNYWQALIMLYRQSLVVPAPLADALSPTEDVESPSMTNVEDAEDEDDIYLKVAEAGQKVLRLYRQLHRVRLVNYTYLATHHLFMAGISFLYAIWHSPVVRSRLTLDDVDFTVLAATSVLGDLMEKCPPAEACRDAFERMSKATVQMCLSTTGFGSDTATTGVQLGAPAKATVVTDSTTEPSFKPHEGHVEGQQSSMPMRTQQQQQQQQQPGQRQAVRLRPQFDMGLHDLFPSDDGMDEGGRQLQQYRHGGRPIQHRLRTNSYPAPQYPSRQHYEVKYEEPRIQRQQQHQHTQPQHQHQQHQYTYQNPQHAYNPHLSPITPQNSHSDQDYFSSMEYLDMVSSATTTSPETATVTAANLSHTIYDHPTAGSDSDGTTDINSMLGFGGGSMSLIGGGVPNAGTGLDLGFGMAVDFQHDWSEGAGYDLFDGFFFGGAGFGHGQGGTGGGGNSNGNSNAASGDGIGRES
ncbi:hypothetical protein AJ79_09917 [Helicocarpus griseus UAMH5409]|uniref:Zn(2)-C6 fungal-type domain-containing protein n=1 Tax=Helicocarpus griseus UAMH5409 TaxID=1447875 RepID=A0A2B7WGU0_9EURO|nr:hypothetical protein AJ79_09917 [Helicocarpus griseus UAMH5409]